MSLFPGPYKITESLPWSIDSSNGTRFSLATVSADDIYMGEQQDHDVAAELCALLNAGWEARQQAAKKSPEQRIADDLGIPVEKLMAIAAEEASAAKMTPGTLPEDAEYWTSGDPDDPEDLPQIVLTRRWESIGIILLYAGALYYEGEYAFDNGWKRITRDEAAYLWRKAIARQAEYPDDANVRDMRREYEQEVRDFCAQPQYEPGVSQGDR